MHPLAQLRLGMALHRQLTGTEARALLWMQQATDALRVMEYALSGHNRTGWIAETACPSIADVALYPYTCMAPMGGIHLRVSPAIRQWLARIEALPGYQHLFPGVADSNHAVRELQP